MPEQSNTEQQTPERAVYANYLRVGQNAFEFFLDFGQRFDDVDEGRFHTRVVTSPEHAASFNDTITIALADHRLRLQESSFPPDTFSKTAESETGEARRSKTAQLLQSLNAVLAHACELAKAEFEYPEGGEPRSKLYRGLYVSDEQAERVVNRASGGVLFGDPESLNAFEDAALLGSFGSRYGFDAFDHAVILLALSPEMGPGYSQVFAYLQDDVSKRRPTVQLALDLFCSTLEQQVERRQRFLPSAPLVNSGLLPELTVADARTPLNERVLTLPEVVVSYLNGRVALGPELSGFCALQDPPAGGPVQTGLALGKLLGRAALLSRDRQILLHFSGTDAAEKRRAAAAIALLSNRALLSVNPSAVPRHAARKIVPAVVQAAALTDSLLFVPDLDLQEHSTFRAALMEHLSANPADAVFTGRYKWVPSGDGSHSVVDVAFPTPDVTARAKLWSDQLKNAELEIDDGSVHMLASRFTLTGEQIANAVSTAKLRISLQDGDSPEQRRQTLSASAREQTGHKLAVLARKVIPAYIWDDLIVSDDVKLQLREICDRVRYRYDVLDGWGFGQKLQRGRGVAALFAGLSGSGKTMAAEVIANELDLDLYRIDLASIVSKYIGQTARNLERVFNAAESTNAILLFDEADALFGKRTDVREAHDRFANVEVSYLLQRMEHYDGIAILATNLRGNMDTAFVRRLAFSITFTMPTATERAEIWKRMWVDPKRISPDVDLTALANQFELTGGAIRNIALAASYHAAAQGHSASSRDDLLIAIQREYQKHGRNVSVGELAQQMEVMAVSA